MFLIIIGNLYRTLYIGRNATLRKVPYSIIVGEKEQENKTVSIRDRDGNQFNDIKIEDLIAQLKELIDTRDLSIKLGL